MSNQVVIETRKVEKTYAEEESQFEISVNDDYESGSFPVDNFPDDDMEILQLCKDIGSDVSKGVCSLLDYILDQQKGININDTFYEWDEIKHIFGME